jgi:hypothetical protein
MSWLRRAGVFGCVAAACLGSTALGALPVGYDISYPQCGAALPVGPAFVVLGVNGGLPFKANPCLGAGAQPSQLTWAGPAPGLYINAANPGPALSANWPRGQTAPRECATPGRPGDDTADCAYNYGWNAAANAYSTAVAAFQSVGFAPPGATATPTPLAWWLDVETENSWRPDTALNVASIQGSADFLRAAGAANVGIYSSPGEWQTIAGSTTAFAELPSWVATGQPVQAVAEALCGGPGFTGGGVSLVQFPNPLDANVRCPPLVSLSGEPPSVVAGAAVPLALRLTPAQDGPVTVTVNGSNVAAAAAGPWAAAQAVVVPPGTRSVAPVYFTRRRAGA